MKIIDLSIFFTFKLSETLSFHPIFRTLISIRYGYNEYLIMADQVGDIIGKGFAIDPSVSFCSDAWQLAVGLNPMNALFDLVFKANTKSGRDILVILNGLG
jgi:hypothetical protein